MTALSIGESISLAASYYVLERELHLFVGAPAGRAEEPGLVRYLAAASMAHGWRAALFEALLPVSPGLPSRVEALEAVSSQVAELVGSALSAVRPAELAATLIEDVYPALVASYLDTAGGVSPVSDGALALATRRAAADVHRVASEGMALLGLPDSERGARGAPASSLVGALIRGLTTPLH